MIYKTEGGLLQEDIVTFWTAIERKKQGQPIVQLPAEHKDGEIITTLEKNDMFLLSLSAQDSLKEIDLTKHLYRCQKLSSGDYWFRKHTSSTVTDSHYVSIKSFKAWLTFNPIKVSISTTGKIERM